MSSRFYYDCSILLEEYLSSKYVKRKGSVYLYSINNDLNFIYFKDDNLLQCSGNYVVDIIMTKHPDKSVKLILTMLEMIIKYKYDIRLTTEIF